WTSLQNLRPAASGLFPEPVAPLRDFTRQIRFSRRTAASLVQGCGPSSCLQHVEPHRLEKTLMTGHRMTGHRPATVSAPEAERGASSVVESIARRFETDSPPLRRMLEEVAIAAEHDVTILLIGET